MVNITISLHWLRVIARQKFKGFALLIGVSSGIVSTIALIEYFTTPSIKLNHMQKVSMLKNALEGSMNSRSQWAALHFKLTSLSEKEN